MKVENLFAICVCFVCHNLIIQTYILGQQSASEAAGSASQQAQPLVTSQVPVTTTAVQVQTNTSLTAVGTPVAAQAPTHATNSKSTTPEQPPAMIAYEKELEDINKNLTETLLVKKNLREIVMEVNDKLMDARKKVLEAQRLSFNVLQKTPTEAESLISQASAELSKLQAIQNTVQSDLCPRFNSNVKKVEELIQNIQLKMSELQAKGLKFQVKKAQTEQLSATTDLAQTGVVANEAQQISGTQQATQEGNVSTFYNKIWNWVTDKFALMANYTRKTWKNFKSWAFKSEPTDRVIESDELKKNFKYIKDHEQFLKIYVIESENDIATSIASTRKYLSIFIEIADSIENQLNYLLQTYLVLRFNIKTLENMLVKNDDFRGYLDYCELMDPWWKRHITKNLEHFLDCCVVFYAAFKKIIFKTYSLLFADFINKFLSDVKEKMQKQTEQQSSAN